MDSDVHILLLAQVVFMSGDSVIKRWLTLKAAAEKLNVHPKTLRRWADDGDIPFMLTPGGHRRFDSSDVTELMDVRRSPDKNEKVAGAWARLAMADVRGRVDGDDAAWMKRFNDDTRDQYRKLGRNLVGLAVKYVSEETDRDAIVSEAQSLGREYARLSRESGLRVSDALKMSMFFRETVVGSALKLSNDFHVRSVNESELIRRINLLINNVQLAVVEVYDANDTDPLLRA
jgi:excisionase family DNA binding protein